MSRSPFMACVAGKPAPADTDLDAEESRLTICRQIIESRGRLGVWPPKTKSGKLPLDIDPMMLGSIVARQHERDAEREGSTAAAQASAADEAVVAHRGAVAHGPCASLAGPPSAPHGNRSSRGQVTGAGRLHLPPKSSDPTGGRSPAPTKINSRSVRVGRWVPRHYTRP